MTYRDAARRSLAVTLVVSGAAALTVGLAGCDGSAESSAQDDALVVAVSVPPQAYVVERVGDERVEVVTMADAGDDPHTYEPSPRQLRDLVDADVYLTVGVEFEEAWLPRFESVNPDMVVVDQAEAVDRIEGTGDTDASHDHEEDPHVWTSPAAVAEMARTTRDTLADLDPDGAEAYDDGLASLEEDIEALDAEIRDGFAAAGGADGAAIVVLHPAWGYFAHEYGLEQVSIEVGGQEPSAAEMGQLVRLMEDEGVAVIFAQPTQDTRTADVLAEEVGGRVVLVDPLAADWLENEREVSEEFAAAIGGDSDE